MRHFTLRLEQALAACILMLLLSAATICQTAKSAREDTAAAAAHAQQLKPQTSCPVTGEAIDRKLYVDYKGKRIYVCCASCTTQVRQDPEKYMRKLARMGQSVETIGKAAHMETRDSLADTSMRPMNMKMAPDTTAKAAIAGYWTCTMHPEVHQSAPGNCPVCGMKLVFVGSAKDSTSVKSRRHHEMKM
jgi:YHS domain-containing protein